MAGNLSNPRGDLSSRVPIIVVEGPGSTEQKDKNDNPQARNPTSRLPVRPRSFGQVGGILGTNTDGGSRAGEKEKETSLSGSNKGRQQGKEHTIGSSRPSSVNVDGSGTLPSSPTSSGAGSPGCSGSMTSQDSQDYDTVAFQRDGDKNDPVPIPIWDIPAMDSNPRPPRPPNNQKPAPSYDDCKVTFSGAITPEKPEKRPLPQDSPSKCKMEECVFDVIELQKDSTGKAPSPVRNDVKDGTKKEEKVTPFKAMSDIPNTNFAIACMVALCFNLPFGILAMYFSLRAVRAYQEGRHDMGERRSRFSIVLSLLGITITTVIISSVVLYIAIQGQKRISRHRAYQSKGGLNL
ncbi:hypothetical protein C0Q70_00377 [Pomacea canaliculata]|uniref:Uncharacterized protein n=1 Tax=Pomacea canaliculata TaxID=400727 RepID=A0A2T7PWG6_POMCA|nr:uncharacterized protein LOC112565405 [Pomacea canaliculata]PVD37776.1 hypothetical protein C0Q70_00377 [Pomacea canaliculata]